eukprot:GHVQ01037945.1.p1 GENE.GHVQ01037945.1~~GHVQ01037945.1.p1  ORF type:complete len:299 (+),score=36.74 GHVQ01037945.1:174-1070(+)
MVFLAVKSASSSSSTNSPGLFRYCTPAATTDTTALLSKLLKIHNQRLLVLQLAQATRELVQHGPLRPEETRGLSADAASLSGLDVNEYGIPNRPDETCYRTGVVVENQNVLDTMERTVNEVDEKLGLTCKTTQASGSSCLPVLDEEMLQTMFDNILGAVMIAYPDYHRLPAWDPCHVMLKEKTHMDNREVLGETSTSLWWSGKQMPSGHKLSEVLKSSNDKTTIIVRLHPTSSGPPVREPRVDAETHKAMLARYHKHQEEQKLLETDTDDSYLNTEWANPRGLKNSLIGGGTPITWRA